MSWQCKGLVQWREHRPKCRQMFAVWPWEKPLASLNLRVFVCTMRTLMRKQCWEGVSSLQHVPNKSYLHTFLSFLPGA